VQLQESSTIKTIQKETNCSNKIPISTNVGENSPEDGNNLYVREVTIITNLSNHIPIFTTIEIINENIILVLNFLNHELWRKHITSHH
jgi:hypothetical protein